MNSGFDKSPSAALRRSFLHCDVALLRLARKARRALHLELLSNPLLSLAREVLG